MNKNTTILPLVAALMLVGCKTPVVFTTHTSLGLDVSGTAQMPNKVSFSYNRFEGAIVPRKTNGMAHSVYGGMDADIKFFGGHTIKQTFATGKAAMLATGDDDADGDRGTSNANQDALVFVTATTFGLHLTAGEQQMSPNLLMGYRRTEGAIIPVPDPGQEVRSVYADILINSDINTNNTTITTNFSALRGVRIKQSFATGSAAENLARYSDEVRSNLEHAAGAKVASDIMKRNKSRAVGIVEQIGRELDRLENEQLSKAIECFARAGLLSASEVTALNDLEPRTRCRTLKQVARDHIRGAELLTETVDNLDKILSELRTTK